MSVSPGEQANRALFLKALQKDPLQCSRPACGGGVAVQDLSQVHDRVKTFELRCERCDWKDRVTGREQLTPPWDETVLLDMAYEHMMHQPAPCPYDDMTVVFMSLPNPRRQARYRVSCYYCGRQAEMDWPPQEFRR
jgi:hypothetical protein